MGFGSRVRWTLFAALLCQASSGYAEWATSTLVALDGGAAFSIADWAEPESGAWGENGSGQLGDGTLLDRYWDAPIEDSVAGALPLWVLGGVPASSSWMGGGYRSFHSRLAAGGYHALGTVEGVIWAWGDNRHGQLGDGTTENRSYPVPVVDERGVPQISARVSAGRFHSLAEIANGKWPKLMAWGANDHGQLGDGSTEDRLHPVEVTDEDGKPIVGSPYIAAGGEFSLYTPGDCRLYAWGANEHGQLGDGTTEERHHPVESHFADGSSLCVSGFVAGAAHVLAIHGIGIPLYAWGANEHGQLGDGTTEDRLNPVPVTDEDGNGYSNVYTIAAGRAHSLMLWGGTIEDGYQGALLAWGANDRGQLGDGTTEERHRPVAVRDADGVPIPAGDVEAIAAGDDHSLIMLRNGQVLAWGANEHGQLGDGTTEDRLLPVEVQRADGSTINLWESVVSQPYPYLYLAATLPETGELQSVLADLPRRQPFALEVMVDADGLSTPYYPNFPFPPNRLPGDGDLWLTLESPRGELYSYVFDEGWRRGLYPARQGALKSVPLSDIPMSGLPSGVYALLLGMDMVMDGQMNRDSLYAERLWINVRGR